MQWTQNDLVCELNYRKKILWETFLFRPARTFGSVVPLTQSQRFEIPWCSMQMVGEFLNAKAIVETIQEMLFNRCLIAHSLRQGCRGSHEPQAKKGVSWRSWLPWRSWRK
jgi:hypothetical protein